MKKTHLILIGVGCLGSLMAWASEPASPGKSETFSIDPVHSMALFRVHHLGAGRFYGRFNDVTGTFTFAEGSASDLRFDVRIAADSVDTGSPRLDGHLKSPDFFNAREFPELTFTSTSAELIRGTSYEVKGDLTIHGVTRSVRIDVEWSGTADMGKGRRCGFEAIFDVKRADFGMTYGLQQGLIGDDVRVIINMEGIAR